MKYLGSKASIASEIIPILIGERKINQWYVEPFCGGCNLIDKIDGKRKANDINFYLIAMWKALVDGWYPPDYSKEEYNHIKDYKYKYDAHIIGWVGFNCSYSGKWFAGYAGNTKTKLGDRDFQLEARLNVSSQLADLKDVIFTDATYDKMLLPLNSIIYCDPPYKNTTGYQRAFDHHSFWNWVRRKSLTGHSVFVSEYTAPKDFKCVYEKQISSSLSANGLYGGNKNSVERLFKYKRK